MYLVVVSPVAVEHVHVLEYSKVCQMNMCGVPLYPVAMPISHFKKLSFQLSHFPEYRPGQRVRFIYWHTITWSNTESIDYKKLIMQ